MLSNSSLTDNKTTGLIQWFHKNEYQKAEQAIEDFKALGIDHIRTNISWAEYHTAEGRKWYKWLMDKLGKDLQVLPCILYTPPSIGIKAKTSAPPLNPKDYADFVDLVITEYGKYFEYIELWNEPNNLTEYDFTLDPSWDIFCNMVGSAANWSRKRGKKTVLGGMSPIDPNWLREMFRKGLMEYIDVVGIHGFPNVFDYNWEGWNTETGKIQQVLDEHHSDAKLWITEAGFSTWQKNERRQLAEFIHASDTNAERVYWYGLYDLAPELPTVTGFHLDDREYHFGIKKHDGSPKLLYTLLAEKGPDRIREFEWMTRPVVNKPPAGQPYVLVTGGAGFVGTNLADRLLSEGKRVMVFDNLSRSGVKKNLDWLMQKHPDNLSVMIADTCDKYAVTRAVSNASQVFHFAAQVAVTTSLVNPYHDFEVNALGTLNLMEAVRNATHNPPVIFTSTNKVYGNLHDVDILEGASRYYPGDERLQAKGISEDRALDFHSPYGCTKGVADQYILDYARTFGLKTAVFRMSCIYGLHQFGTEDQGWVAHFLIQALKKNPIMIYGDGKQVRDILFVEDLVNAFCLAMDNINKLSGNAYNIGGGPGNTVSLLELIEMVGDISGEQPEVKFNDWRPSDQKYYVSDYSRLNSATGWKAEVDTREGVERLYHWLLESTTVPQEGKERKHAAAVTPQAT